MPWRRRVLSEIDPADCRSEIFLRAAQAARTARIRQPGPRASRPMEAQRLKEAAYDTRARMEYQAFDPRGAEGEISLTLDRSKSLFYL